VVAGLLGLILAGGGLRMLTFEAHSRPASQIKVVHTPERLARGAYLTRSVLACGACHGSKEMGSTAKVDHLALTGGECWTRDYGFPGTLCATNLSADPETGLGSWTDGEVDRALREGVSRDGRALMGVMPYDAYRHLSDEDAHAVVAHLRTLPAVKHAMPAPDIDFPVSFFIKLGPEPLAGPVVGPDPTDPVARGRYLATVAGCQGCHTPVDGRHQPLPGRDFAGGQVFEGPFGAATSSNLTPHAKGLRADTAESFVALFRNRATAASEPNAKQTTPMPWSSYGSMTREDLNSLYEFFSGLKALDSTTPEP